MIHSKATAFNDGLLHVYSCVNAGEPGGRPVKRLALSRVVRYARRVVGVTRHWEALRAASRVDLVLRIPRAEGIDASFICALRDGDQYSVQQVQHTRDDVGQPVTDLSLRRLETRYEIADDP